ncbi:DNA-binding SARP family transcriptional activator [Streptomyces sp. SAI-124]
MSERLRVGVLGPLLLRRGETVVSAGPPQRRALLSALVLRRGTPASVRELADELWGEEAPPSAVAVIRSYVHQLRRTLGSDPAAGVAIQSSSGGYFAEIAAGVLDLQVFERLVADADRARTAGDRVAAADRLREALGLWRGPALADVAGPGADRHRRALAQRQLSALTTRLALDLELDRHHAVVPELHSLVLAHPLNEHLRQLVMTALYRCGRQADAIATYQQCRRLLADELGCGPRSRAAAVLSAGGPRRSGPGGRRLLTCRPSGPPARVTSRVRRPRGGVTARRRSAGRRRSGAGDHGDLGYGRRGQDHAGAALGPPRRTGLRRRAALRRSARIRAGPRSCRTRRNPRRISAGPRCGRLRRAGPSRGPCRTFPQSRRRPAG